MTAAANRLAGETSPYLLQHAHNPVDWYPWGEEALEKARSEDKPILLSIGYSACHWCHVMERESFEDDATAAQMNEQFVSVKVDREERPDLDAIYMDAVQAMSGHGGWPMTVFLTPEGIPFYGGTYFPPEDRGGMPSFRRVMSSVRQAWDERRDELKKEGRRVFETIMASTTPRPSDDPLSASLFTGGVRSIGSSYDQQAGGFGRAPKFPQPPVLELMLRASVSPLGDAGIPARQMVEVTCDRMARGGIYDQLGGGFARYSVDAAWLVPHFEKMLYDNAQLARVYLHLWQGSKVPLFARIAAETLEYLIRDMRSPDGAFYSSEDADSEGEEGRFYVWSYEDFTAAAPGAAGYYGVTREGNFEGRNILTAAGPEPPEEARAALLEARSRRVRPGRDDKVLASWNGMAVAVLAEAGRILGRPDLTAAARDAASFVLGSMSSGGRLLHSFREGRARVTGLAEDYAYVAEGLLTLWETTFEPRWFEEALRLTDQMLELFWDPADGGLFTTASDHEKLVARRKEIAESVTPSPNGVAAGVLLKLAVLTGREEYSARAVSILRLALPYMKRHAQATASFLGALDFHLSGPREIAIVGDEGGSLTRVIWDRLLYNKVLAGAPPGIDSPLLEGRTGTGKSLAYVCEGYVCHAPASDPEMLAAQLG